MSELSKMNKARIQASDRRPVEEIDAIMVKYSAWASSRAPKAPPPNGIREVTYSSALRASSSRRKLLTDIALPVPPAMPQPPRRQPRKPKPSSSRRNGSPANSETAPQKQSTPTPAKASQNLQRPTNRVVSLSVRLAAEECALVRSRAAEARLSVSAYLRQCVLEVDAMRIFVEKISAELQQTASATHAAFTPALLPVSVPAGPSLPPLVTRCCNAIRRLFSR